MRQYENRAVELATSHLWRLHEMQVRESMEQRNSQPRRTNVGLKLNPQHQSLRCAEPCAVDCETRQVCVRVGSYRHVRLLTECPEAQKDPHLPPRAPAHPALWVQPVTQRPLSCVPIVVLAGDAAAGARRQRAVQHHGMGARLGASRGAGVGDARSGAATKPRALGSTIEGSRAVVRGRARSCTAL
jgi:hypothetical protein